MLVSAPAEHIYLEPTRAPSVQPSKKAVRSVCGLLLRSVAGGRRLTGRKNWRPGLPLRREFLRSAKGAARATKLDQELIALRSVLREFLKELKSGNAGRLIP